VKGESETFDRREKEHLVQWGEEELEKRKEQKMKCGRRWKSES